MENAIPISINQEETKKSSAASSVASLIVDFTSSYSEKSSFSFSGPYCTETSSKRLRTLENKTLVYDWIMSTVKIPRFGWEQAFSRREIMLDLWFSPMASLIYHIRTIALMLGAFLGEVTLEVSAEEDMNKEQNIDWSSFLLDAWVFRNGISIALRLWVVNK